MPKYLFHASSCQNFALLKSMFIGFFNTKQKIFIENGKIKKKILYRVFSATDIFDLLIFQLKRPYKLAYIYY